MLRNRAVVLMAMVLLTMAFCLTTTALAQGTCSTCPAGNQGTCSTCPSGNPVLNPVNPTGIQNPYAPTGAGPAEVCQTFTVAPIGVIMQRGYVTNVAEAQAVAMDAIQRSGGMASVGDYKVAYYLSAPQGFYKMKHCKLVWNTPSCKDNMHIDVLVMDCLTGMPIPVNKLKVDVLDQSGRVVNSRTLTYAYGCLGASYGSNLQIPCAGNYSLNIYAPAPNFYRNDCMCGNRLNCPIQAQFACVPMTPVCPPTGAGPCNPCGVNPCNTCPPVNPCNTCQPVNPCNTCPQVNPPCNTCPPANPPCNTCPTY